MVYNFWTFPSRGASMGQPFFRQMADEFHPKRLFPSLVAGLISGILTVIIEISLAALIFSGDLARFVSNGIGITLFGSFVIGVVVALNKFLAWGSGRRAGYSGRHPGSGGCRDCRQPGNHFSFARSDLCHGSGGYCSHIACHRDRVPADGYFPAGRLDPLYPVPGDRRFPGRDGLAAGQRLLWRYDRYQPDIGRRCRTSLKPVLLDRWLPGLLFAILLYAVVRRYNHFLIIPGLVLAAILAFYIVMWVTNSIDRL